MRLLSSTICLFGLALSVSANNIACKPPSHPVDPSAAPSTAPNAVRVAITTTVDPSQEIILELTRDWAPKGVDRLYQLFQDHFFECATFFRVVPGFVVQFGLAAEPEETNKWDTIITDDLVVQSNLQGTISFATAGPNTRTTQLFVNLMDNYRLDDMDFAPVGRVIQGMDILQRLYNPTPDSSGGISQGDLKRKGTPWARKTYPDIDLILSVRILENS